MLADALKGICVCVRDRVKWIFAEEGHLEEGHLPTMGALLGLLVTVRAAVAPAAPALHAYWMVWEKRHNSGYMMEGT